VGVVQDADDEDSVGPAPAPAPPQQPDLTDAEVEARLKIENIRYKHDYQAYLPNEHSFDLMPTIIQNSINHRYL